LINRLLSKLASGSEVLGNLGAQEHRSVFNIHENSSPKLRKQFTAEVEFGKKYNLWFVIIYSSFFDNFYKKDKPKVYIAIFSSYNYKLILDGIIHENI